MDIDSADQLLARAAAADRGELQAPGDPATPGGPAPQGAAPGAPAAPDPKLAQRERCIAAAHRYGAIARAMVPDRAKPHWTDERLGEVGNAFADCAEHYGWELGAMVTHPLAMLAATTFPLAWPILEPYALPYIKQALSGKPRELPPSEPAPGQAAAPAT